MFRSLEKTSVPTPPVSLADAKLALRIGADDTSLDAVIQDLVTAATERAEHDTDRSLTQVSWLLTMPSWIMSMVDLGRPPMQTLPAWPLYIACWPLAPYLELPRPPLVSVDAVHYYDANGNFTALDAAIYTVDLAPRCGRICLLPNQVWPIVSRRWDSVQISFTAGWPTPAAVPAGIRVGIKKLTSYWFYNPGAGDVPPEIARIFEQYAVKLRGYAS
jgi:hypothetical protein